MTRVSGVVLTGTDMLVRSISSGEILTLFSAAKEWQGVSGLERNGYLTVLSVLPYIWLQELCTYAHIHIYRYSFSILHAPFFTFPLQPLHKLPIIHR